jgi:5-formyltetrahydrofolate cyclo-ligase
MDEIQEKKFSIRKDIQKDLDALDEQNRVKKTEAIAKRLFEFANFLESKIVLFYMNKKHEIVTLNMIKISFELGKILILPAFDAGKHEMQLFKVDNVDADLKNGPRAILEPNPDVCKMVPIEHIDLAIIPGIAFDEKGGRIGYGKGYYDRLIPKLSITTRKVAFAFESQIVQQIPMESHDKFVDIIITENRIIYKI